MTPCGWSFGDIVCAIKVISNIIDGFIGAYNAKSKYADASSFLLQLRAVMQHMSEELESNGQSAKENPNEHCQAICSAYWRFDHYLEKTYHGLSAKSPGKAKQILATIRWSLDEMSDKVLKLKAEVSLAMQAYQTAMLQEIKKMVNKLIRDSHDIPGAGEKSDQHFDEVRAMILVVEEQNKSLHEASLECQKRLCLEQNELQNKNTALIRQDLAEIKMTQEVQAKNEDFAALHEAHASLKHSQQQLLAMVQEQHDRALSKEEAERWEKLQERLMKEAEKQAAEQRQAKQDIEAQFTNATGALRGTSQLTGDGRFTKVADQCEGSFKILSFVKGLFGNDKDDDAEQVPSSPDPRAPVPSRKEAKSAHSMPLAAPPQRIDRICAAPPPMRRSELSSGHRKVLSPPPPDRSPPPLPVRRPEVQPVSMSNGRRGTVASISPGCDSIQYRPALPARPNANCACRPSVVWTDDRPPLPPRSPATSPGLSSEPASVEGISCTVPDLGVARPGHRASSHGSLVTDSIPSLTKSSATPSSCSVPETFTDGGESMESTRPPGFSRVAKWIASTAAVDIELSELVLDTGADEDYSMLSVSQRRRRFERSPIMGAAKPTVWNPL